MGELLRKVAALGLAEPITLVLDNARNQRNARVQVLATQLVITLLYLPSYSPNLNLIERSLEIHQTSRSLRKAIGGHSDLLTCSPAWSMLVSCREQHERRSVGCGITP
jgi:transposase